MKYVSTRGGMAEKSFTEVLLMGLAPDGGLVVPKHIPTVNEKTLSEWQNLSYQQLAFEIFSLYIDDIPSEDLQQMVSRVYDKSRFGSDEITPLRKVNDNLSILELSNGPTLAFKDIAMQFLGEVFEYVLKKQDKQINILGATSGDTGSAAEYAMLNKSRVNVFMLSPHERMSEFQQAQMFSLDEPNIFNLSVKGVFDDCQDIVKAVNADKAFKEKYQIGAVNSINWARILAQTVYYFKGYFAAIKSKPSQPVSFVVPSGNFGNVYAGFVARQMGLPIEKLVVATNENNVLCEFFNTGVYQVRPSEVVLETSSPSMDIGKASNFERYIYNLLGNNSEKIKALWSSINDTGKIDLSNHKLIIDESEFMSFASFHDDRLKTINQMYTKYNDLIDPHTADGVFAANQYLKQYSAHHVVNLETALPEKFEHTIRDALGKVPKMRAEPMDLSTDRNTVVIENDYNKVKLLIINSLTSAGV